MKAVADPDRDQEGKILVYIVPPAGSTRFVTAGRFRLSESSVGEPIGAFVYGRRYPERPDAVVLDPVELRLRRGVFETARMGGFFGAITILNRMIDMVQSEWRAELRQAGVSEADCHRLEGAFLYPGLFNTIEFET